VETKGNKWLKILVRKSNGQVRANGRLIYTGESLPLTEIVFARQMARELNLACSETLEIYSFLTKVNRKYKIDLTKGLIRINPDSIKTFVIKTK
jgi:predicted aspartyl protease